jgi:hypothetical protein
MLVLLVQGSSALWVCFRIPNRKCFIYVARFPPLPPSPRERNFLTPFLLAANLSNAYVCYTFFAAVGGWFVDKCCSCMRVVDELKCIGTSEGRLTHQCGLD